MKLPLEEILRLRVAAAVGNANLALDDVWPSLCVSHISTSGEESLVFLIDRCLMRPRCLIELVRSCQASAVTLGHDRIEESDLREGLEDYSVELAANIGLEIRDVFPAAPDILYELLGSDKRMPRSDIEDLLKTKGLAGAEAAEFFELLLWYGVLGLIDRSGESQYIYMHRYELKRLHACQLHLTDKSNGTVEINPAFWSALEIERI